MKKSKIEMETLGKLLLLTAFLIIFLLMFKGCKDQMENVGTVGTKEYVCWFSHALKGQISFLFPSACYPIDVEKEQDQKGISVLMRKCWWMHGQGEEDIITGESRLGQVVKKGVSWYDIARTCYIFMPDKNIPIKEFITYLQNYDKSGKEVEKTEDFKKTTWGYIQKKPTEETGVCFDQKTFDPQTTGDVLYKGKTYYIIFYDDRSPRSKGLRDKIMISRDPEFGAKEVGFLAWASKVAKELLPFNFKDACYNVVDEMKEEVAKQTAYKVFDEVFPKFGACFKTTITESCLCDGSEINLEGLPKGYEIRINKQDKHLYSMGLYKGADVLKEESLNINIGFWSNVKSEVSQGLNPQSQTVCDEGLGFKKSISVSSFTPVFSLMLNIDSRFLLNPSVYRSLIKPQEMVTPCRGIAQDNSGAYKGMYIFTHSFNTETKKFYMDPYEVPVLKYCSGSPVSREAEKEIKKRETEKQTQQERETCEGYKTESECFSHLDKCYPQFSIATDNYQACKYCGDGFDCSYLPEKYCTLIKPCGETCEMVGMASTKICTKKK